MVSPVHFQGTVASIDQIGRRVHDRAQGGVQLQPGGDHQHRLHQAVETVAALDDEPDTFLHLGQQLTQAQLGQCVPQRRHTRVGLVPRRLRRSHGQSIHALAMTSARLQVPRPHGDHRAAGVPCAGPMRVVQRRSGRSQSVGERVFTNCRERLRGIDHVAQS